MEALADLCGNTSSLLLLLGPLRRTKFSTEMTSMAPTSGGQYHWISEFSPPRFQKYLSYAAGWTSALGWLTGNASGYYILSTLVEALVEVYE